MGRQITGAKTDNPNLNQVLNPYLPSWEYVPDGEPHVFGDRVYVYGSHDRFGGNIYCENDYVCYSAPVDNLGDWRFEGETYTKTQDPENEDGHGMLYAPDVAKGPDGRYYLYYAINAQNHIGVAVCDTPGGKYEFYGYVHHADGTKLGDLKSDEMQFDPGVLCEDGKTYLYTGFCAVGDDTHHGSMLSVLDSDMLTIIEEPTFVVPSDSYSKGTSFEGHEIFEASSIRKINGKYYFVYSSIKMHELCYAIADDPRGPFEYKGVIISNGDIHIDTYKDANKCTYYCANNHGSLEVINGECYIFYHRHTNGTQYSRQACFEKLSLSEDGTIQQAMMTSCGNIRPLKAQGMYPSYIVCNLFTREDETYVPWQGWMDARFPKVTQDGADGTECYGYVTNMCDGATAGFKYFDFQDVKEIALSVKGFGRGVMEVRTSIEGEVLGRILIEEENVWTRKVASVAIPNGVHDLYFTYNGKAWTSIRDFEFIC